MILIERLLHPLRPRRFVQRRLVSPIQAFMALETASGIVIVAAAVIALIWANSPWDQQYFDLWATHVNLDFNMLEIEETLGELINDGLMVIFFFVVGLEIKREIHHGELSSPKSAAMPVIAAAGGMAMPALIYLIFNAGGDATHGWAIPVATDIAFAVGVLALVGNRVPFSLKVFLLALAIADDLGGIVVIAVFYTEKISFEALGWVVVILLVINMFRIYGVRTLNVYVVCGALLWVAMLKSGIHATIAGVLLAIFTPASSYYEPEGFERNARTLLDRLPAGSGQAAEDQRQAILSEMEQLSRDSESPLDRLEHVLNPWVSFVIVPIFALANAGVVITGESISDAMGSSVTWGVMLGLILGKPLGIMIASWLAVRFGIATMPSGIVWRQMLGVALLGGVGFTVALFITELAFDSEVLINDAKMGILSGSFVAAIIGYLFLMLQPAKPTEERVTGQAAMESPAGGR